VRNKNAQAEFRVTRRTALLSLSIKKCNKYKNIIVTPKTGKLLFPEAFYAAKVA
jgi:hypothetical protein